MDRFSKDLFSRDSPSRDPFSSDLFRTEFSRDPFDKDELSLDRLRLEQFSRDVFSSDPFARDLNSPGDRMITENKMMLSQFLDGDMSILQNIHCEEIVTEYKSLGDIKDPKKKKTLLELIRKKGAAAYNTVADLLKKEESDKSKPERKESIAAVNTSLAALEYPDTAVSSVIPQASDDRIRDTPVSSITRQASEEKVTDHQKFLKKNRKSLINNVKNVDEMTDDMENFTDGQRSKIQAESTDQCKMRLVLGYTTSTTAAAILVRVLYQHAPDVMKDLTSG